MSEQYVGYAQKKKNPFITSKTDVIPAERKLPTANDSRGSMRCEFSVQLVKSISNRHEKHHDCCFSAWGDKK